MSLSTIIKSLRRVTSKGVFIPEIDGLRFLAIAPVVFMHANTNYNRIFEDNLKIDSTLYNYLINQGGKGVWIFFAISGFILSYFFAKHFYVEKKSLRELNLKAYFIRRLTRLEPPFLISMIVLFFFTSTFVVHSYTALLPNFLASITYSHNIFYGKWSPINPVTWSLEVEIQFYLIAPFISAGLFVLGENLRTILLILMIVLIPYFVFDPDSPFISNPHLAKTIPAYLHHFLIGVLLASIYTGKYWEKLRPGILWDLICIVSIGMAFYIEVDVQHVFSFYLFDFLLLLIMIGAFKGTFVNDFFSNPIITSIGGMCYSIYLIHYAVVFGVSNVMKYYVIDSPIVNYGFHIFGSVTIVLVLSIIFFKFCERPFMDKFWPQKFSRWFLDSFSSKKTPTSV